MKFGLYFCCISIVWGIAFAGCSLKHNENVPHNSIRLQAKADAESDASHDVSLLAYFGAGLSAPLAAGTCGLMTGSVGVLIVDENVGFFLSFISVSVISAAVLSIGIADNSPPPNPPPERVDRKIG